MDLDPGARRSRWLPAAARAPVRFRGELVRGRRHRRSPVPLTSPGTGWQNGSFKRWGDYSTMSVNAVDGCTVWYTQEYYANSGFFGFKTRIGSFRLPGC